MDIGLEKDIRVLFRAIRFFHNKPSRKRVLEEKERQGDRLEKRC